MSILDLSKSLIDAVNSVIDAHNKDSSKLYDKTLSEGLKKFKVSSISELSKEEQKSLHSWIQLQLQEASCCGCDKMKEELSADDVVKSELEKMGKSLGELSPEEKKELFNKVEVKVKAKNESINEVLDLTSGTEEEAIKRAIDDFLKSDAPQFKGKSKDEIIDMAVAAVKKARGTSNVQEALQTIKFNTNIESSNENPLVTVEDAKEKLFLSHANLLTINKLYNIDIDSSVIINKKIVSTKSNRYKNPIVIKLSKFHKNALKEGIETEPEDIATNGAVGVTDPEKQMPVHVDVLKDRHHNKDELQYRLFVQFNVNDIPKIVPPPSLPGASSIEELRELVSGMSWYGQEVEDALTNALDIPSEDPSISGDA